MKKIILLCICILLMDSSMVASSQSVSESLARQVAMNFFSLRNGQTNFLRDTCEIRSIGRELEPAMYAVSIDSDWVLVSADKRVEPILAYSDNHQGHFPSGENIPPAMIELLDWYEHMISSHKKSEETRVNPNWEKYSNNNDIDEAELSRSEVNPLLKRNGHFVAWGQADNNSNPSNTNKVYNLFCPSGNNCDHTLAGCVAVAMAQVMWYWQWPLYAVVKNDNNQYIYRDYNWDNIVYQLTNNSRLYEVIEVATLLHDVGVSVSMDYGCIFSEASNSDVSNALTHTFGYAADNIKYRNDYTDSAWISILKNDLNIGRPIIYSGQLTNSLGGHSFVIHGYDNYDRFYINFGWRRTGDGYFLLNNIQYGTDCYCSYQSAITGIHKQTPSCNDITIQPTNSWYAGFTCINGGGITIGNRFVLSTQTGRIYSNEYIKLTNGFHVDAGANVHIAIRPVPCSPMQQLFTSDAEPESSEAPTHKGISENLSPANNKYCTVNPNPATDYISLNSSERIIIAAIFNLNGQKVWQGTDSDINVSFLSAGVYVIHAQTMDGNILQTKFIKQ